MSKDLRKIGQDLLDMGHRMIAAHNESEGGKKKEEKEDDEKMGKKIDMPSPKRAVIIASLKRKIGE